MRVKDEPATLEGKNSKSLAFRLQYYYSAFQVYKKKALVFLELIVKSIRSMQKGERGHLKNKNKYLDEEFYFD
jgi:hypothetical protein